MTGERLFPNAPYRDPKRIWWWEQHQAHYEAHARAAAHERIMRRQATALIESIFRIPQRIIDQPLQHVTAEEVRRGR